MPTSSSKVRVAVLYGGLSPEHEISLQSATAIIRNLDKNKFEVIPISIDKQGNGYLNDLNKLNLSETIPLKTKESRLVFPLGEFFDRKKSFCQVVFPVLHGAFGEDGRIQGLLEMLNIPYVGANVLGSAIGMDKDISKRLVSADNIPVVPFLVFNSAQWQTNSSYYRDLIKKQWTYPVFVKPANTGSSLGITKVIKSDELEAAIQLALSYDIKILVEKALDIHEVEVAVLENLTWGEAPLVSCLGEIVPKHEFYSYEAKYLDKKGAELSIPAVIKAGQSSAIKTFAAKIFISLACEGMARIDFFIDKLSQVIYFNEINTIPGFTEISMYPKLWEASGISYQQLLTHLIKLAINRHNRLSLLKGRDH